MISKNLKVGDIFEDGGRKYKVTKVVENGYESEAFYGEPEAAPEVKPESEPESEPKSEPESELKAEPEAAPEVKPGSEPEAAPEVTEAPKEEAPKRKKR